MTGPNSDLEIPGEIDNANEQFAFMAKRIQALEAAAKKMAEAVRPFSRLLTGLREDCPDSMVCPSHGVALDATNKPISVAITYGDLRKAAVALEAYRKANK